MELCRKRRGEDSKLGYFIGVETGKWFLINWNVLDKIYAYIRYKDIRC